MLDDIERRSLLGSARTDNGSYFAAVLGMIRSRACKRLEKMGRIFISDFPARLFSLAIETLLVMCLKFLF